MHTDIAETSVRDNFPKKQRFSETFLCQHSPEDRADKTCADNMPRRKKREVRTNKAAVCFKTVQGKRAA
jgi:hypothetical protein